MTILLPDAILRDTYVVEKFLGEGAFAEVYRVRHRFLGRQALKVFKRTGMSMRDIDETLGEALILTRIGHPNIVRVFDANVFDSEHGPCGYFTMEYVAAGSLQKFWQSFGNNLIPVATTMELIKQVCRGLAVAHRARPSIVHRDIKPQNILVGYEADGLRARISDFGLAKSVNPLTLLATTAGTIGFKPPEAFAQRRGDSCVSDVWSVAATLYLLLTDRLPFCAKDSGSATRTQTALVPASQINPNVTEELDSVLVTALHPDPVKRYQDADALLVALEAAERAPVTRPVGRHYSRGPSKAVLGDPSSENPEEAESLVARAVELGREGRLSEAADAMEEAFNRSPALRKKFASTVELWRRGIAM